MSGPRPSPSPSPSPSNRATKSWAHKYFWTPQEISGTLGQTNHHGCRFCKAHFPDIADIPKVLDGPRKQFGWTWPGCCPYETKGGRSPGTMEKHMKRYHPELLSPVERGEHHDGFSPAGDSDSESGSEAADLETTREYVKAVVIEDLQEFNAASRKGFRRFMTQHCKKVIGRRGMITKIFDDLAVEGLQKVTEMLAPVKQQGIKFTVSGDSWRTKGKFKQHFFCMFVHYIDEQWKRRDVCIGAVKLDADRDEAQYKEQIVKILGSVGLEPANIATAISDHEGSIRNALASFGWELIGCSCHLIQLPIQHIIPPMRKKQKRCMSVSSTSSDSEPAVVEQPPAAPASAASAEPPKKKGRPPLSQTDPERYQLTEDMKPLTQKARNLYKHLVACEDDYNTLMSNCEKSGIPFRRFAQESAVRWSSFHDHLCSHLANDHGLCVHWRKAPPKLNDEEIREVQHICGVLTAFRTATKNMEGDAATASMIEAELVGLINLCDSEYTPWPSCPGEFGARGKIGKAGASI